MSFILEMLSSGRLRNSLVELCSRQLETLRPAWEESRGRDNDSDTSRRGRSTAAQRAEVY